MALDSVKAYGKVREALFVLVSEIDHGEALYSEDGIREIKALAYRLVSACEKYKQAVQEEESQ